MELEKWADRVEPTIRSGASSTCKCFFVTRRARLHPARPPTAPPPRAQKWFLQNLHPLLTGYRAGDFPYKNQTPPHPRSGSQRWTQKLPVWSPTTQRSQADTATSTIFFGCCVKSQMNNCAPAHSLCCLCTSPGPGPCVCPVTPG